MSAYPISVPPLLLANPCGSEVAALEVSLRKATGGRIAKHMSTFPMQVTKSQLREVEQLSVEIILEKVFLHNSKGGSERNLFFSEQILSWTCGSPPASRRDHLSHTKKYQHLSP